MISEPVIDHALLQQRLERARKLDIVGADFLLQHAATEIDERLSIIERVFDAPYQIHGYTKSLANRISERGQAQNFTFVDTNKIDDTRSMIGDRDLLDLESQQADLIVSPLSLHLTNDTPGVLKQMHMGLKADGLLMAATLGAGTLSELRECLITAEGEIYSGASARIIPFADIQDYGALLQRAGFALPVIDGETITVRYDDVFALMHDLRAMGMTNPLINRSKKPVSRNFFERTNEIYKEKFSDADGRLRASFSIIYLTGWKPHESQQKPLRPGSAKTRLSDALNVNEIKLPK